MRHVTLAARRAQQYLRPPPHPPWVRTVVCIGAGLLGLGIAFWSTSWIMDGGVRNAWDGGPTAGGVVGQAGLVVRDVFVEGRRRTPPEALRTQLGIHVGMPLLAFDTAATKERLERSPGSSRRASRACCPMPCTSACSSVSRSRCGNTTGVSTWSTAPAR